ncbi:unnamed protein product [Strongylus vulgaris]|uniref:U3 small nucleolar RNA-associated protein 20 C-terminal domain-containing protein n=1 Tax=Strongylus vulgaris TaxID=40348 RepID=A0A3P7JVC2_STRVU|nr:unnamed protein product [Strongylus vulgaris]
MAAALVLTNGFTSLLLSCRHPSFFVIADTEELFSMSMEVGEIFKNKIGEQKYAARLASCQKASILKAEERKRKAKELALTNPEEAALLKRKKNVKKTELRKRKIDVLKPYRVINRLHAEKMRAQDNEDD